MTLMRNDLWVGSGFAAPALHRAVGVPCWQEPEPLDPAAALPGLHEHVDLLVRGEDGGVVAYLTLPADPSWGLLIDIATAVAAVARPGLVAEFHAGQVAVEGRAPAEAVVEVRQDPSGAGPVDVWLAGLSQPGSLSFRV